MKDSAKTAAQPTANGEAHEADAVEDHDGESTNGAAVPHASGHGAQTHRRRRATAQSMAAAQRDISVSEFFAKNRHLLGFDNPRKALLTTVKEAVDNSLDACEEAGILPEIWVHIEATGPNCFKIGVQDNGPGILKKQIPLIFGKLLYGSKFHRLRMSRGQQGIGISAAGMYGVLTTGKPVKIISKISKRTPTHYYEIQIDTKKNKPEILNGRGEGVDIPSGDQGAKYIANHGIEWVPVNDLGQEVVHGTRVTIELEGRFQRGRGSVDEYLEQTAIANPHVRLHYLDPGRRIQDVRALDRSPAAGAEGDQAASVRRRVGPAAGDAQGRQVDDADAVSHDGLLARQRRRWRRSSARRRSSAPARTSPRSAAHEAQALYHAIQETQDRRPFDRLHLADRRGAAPQGAAPGRAGRVLCGGDAAAGRLSRQSVRDRGRRWPTAARPTAQRVPLDTLRELLDQSDARTLRQFLTSTFAGLGADAADKILDEAKLGTADLARPAQEGRNRQAARRDAQRESRRRADDEHAAVCQSRAAAISARRLRDHADDHGDQLAELRPEPVARLAAQRPGHGDGPHGERLGAVHERIEGGDRRRIRRFRRSCGWPCRRSAASWACISAAG